MSVSVQAPHQSNQPSRKGKKAWRKNVDISEIQAGLEAAREEELHGGILAELPSASIFKVESTGDAVIQKSYNKQNKPLRSDEILAQRSAIPAVDSRKRKDPFSKVGDGVAPAKRRKQGVSHKELDRLRGIAYGGDAVKKDVVKVGEPIIDDLWGQDGRVVQKPGLSAQEKFSFLQDEKAVRAPETLNHKPLSMLASGKAMPAVPKPVEGKSYNPPFEAWESLVDQEGDNEVEKERKRLQDAAEDAELQSRVARSAAEAQQAEEAAEDSAWESEWEGFLSDKEAGSDTERLGASGKRNTERKTKAERNKIERRKAEEQKNKHEKKMAERQQQILRAKELARLADKKQRAKDMQLTSNSTESSDEEEFDRAQVLRRKRFGKIAIPERPLELVLADELQDSLRALKPEGNLLSERFRSMQVRGRIETRKPVWQSKKALRKATEKWSYKDWKLKV